VSGLGGTFGGLGWVDWVLAGVVLLSVIVGVLRGLVFEVLSVLGWFAAYFAAQWLAPALAPRLPLGEPGSAVNYGVAFAAGFVLSLFVWALVVRLLRFVLHATPLAPIDRVLGAGFGLARGAVLLLAIATLVGLTPARDADAWQRSHAAGWLQVAIQGLKPLLPAEWARHWPV
jgi:membrane protein required for colicin V production